MKFLLALVAVAFAKGGRGGRGWGNPCRDQPLTTVQAQLETVAASLLTSGTSYCYLSVHGDEGFPLYKEDDGEQRRELQWGWSNHRSMAQAKITIKDGDFVSGTTQVFVKDGHAEDPASQFNCYEGFTFSVTGACRNWGDDVCPEGQRNLGWGRRRRHRDPETFVQFVLGFDNGDTSPISSEVQCTTHLTPEGENNECIASDFKCSGHYGERNDETAPSGKFDLVCKAEDWDLSSWDDAEDCPSTIEL